MRTKNRLGVYNLLLNLKWGPFWQQAVEKPQSGATLESRGGERRNGAEVKAEEEENGEEGWRGGGAGKAEGAGFNQQQAVGNEITIPPLSD